MAYMTQHKSTDELIDQLTSILEKNTDSCIKFTNKKNPIGSSGRISQITRLSTRSKFECILTILKQQQETIKEQKELIESLWSWAEEKEEREYNEDDYLQTDDIDYRNFKLYDDYQGEREGYVYINGPQGHGYYALKTN